MLAAFVSIFLSFCFAVQLICDNSHFWVFSCDQLMLSFFETLLFIILVRKVLSTENRSASALVVHSTFTSSLFGNLSVTKFLVPTFSGKVFVVWVNYCLNNSTALSVSQIHNKTNFTKNCSLSQIERNIQQTRWNKIGLPLASSPLRSHSLR